MASRDLAELGITIDASGAIIQSNALGLSLDATAAKAQKFTATAAQTDEAWKRSGGSISAFNTIVGQMKAQWEAANTVAAQSSQKMMGQAEAARGLAQASTAAGRAMALKEIDAHKMNAAMGQSFTGVNRVREAVTSMTASVVHSAPGVAQLTSVLGAQALGGPVMIGVLAGLAAVAAAYQFITREAREAADAQDKAVKSLLEWQKAQSYGAAGKFGAEVAASTERLREQRAELDRIKAAIDRPEVRYGEAGLAGGTTNSARKEQLQRQYNELAAAVAAGEAHVAEIRKKATDQSLAETVRNAAALIAAHNLTKTEIENVAALKASIAQRIGDLTKIGGSQSDRADLVGFLKQLNEAGVDKGAARDAKRKEAKDAKDLKDELAQIHRLKMSNLAVDLAMAKHAIGARLAAGEKQHEEALKGVAAQTERIRAAKEGPEAVKADVAAKVAVAKKYVDDMRALWQEGAGRIAADFVKSMAKGFEEVYSLAVKLMRRMEEAKKASGAGYAALKYGAAAIGGGLAGYGAGQAIGAAGGNAAQGALGGAASGAMAGAAFGPWGALVGGIAGAAAGLFGFGSAAKEAAKQMAEAQRAVRLSISGAEADTRGDALGSGTARIKSEIEAMRKAVEDAFSGGGANSDQVRKRNIELARLNALEADRIRILTESIALAKRQAEEDVRVQIIRNNGDVEAADAMAKAIDQERRFIELRKAGISEAMLDELKASEAVRDLANAAAEAKRKADEAAITAAQELEKAAQAAADAARVAYDQARAVEDINVELLRARGDIAGGDALEFQLAQQRRLEEAKANQSQEYVDKLLALQQLQRDQRAAQSLIDSTTGPSSGYGGSRGATSATTTVTATVTDRTALMLVDLTRTGVSTQRSMLSVLKSIDRKMGGGGFSGGAGRVNEVDDALGTLQSSAAIFGGSVAR
jgi:hypothetical protein